MLRSEGRPGAVTAASVLPEQQRTLDRVAGLTTAMNAGERAGVAVQRQAEGRRQGQRRVCGCEPRLSPSVAK